MSVLYIRLQALRFLILTYKKVILLFKLCPFISLLFNIRCSWQHWKVCGVRQPKLLSNDNLSLQFKSFSDGCFTYADTDDKTDIIVLVIGR